MKKVIVVPPEDAVVSVDDIPSTSFIGVDFHDKRYALVKITSKEYRFVSRGSFQGLFEGEGFSFPSFSAVLSFLENNTKTYTNFSSFVFPDFISLLRWLEPPVAPF